MDTYLVADGELRKWGDKAVKLLEDSHQEVREAAMKLLERLVQHFGQTFLVRCAFLICSIEMLLSNNSIE